MVGSYTPEVGRKMFYFSEESVLCPSHYSSFIDFRTGTQFGTVNQAFQFFKAEFFRDWNVMDELKHEAIPHLVKDLSRRIRGFDSVAWSAVKIGYMVYANQLKFTQNKNYANILIHTKDSELVYANPDEQLWSAGLAGKDVYITNRKAWKGKNLLGKCLEKVRYQLNHEFDL
jgi:ribA/ribD-fused uncharacterized protein